MIAKEGTYISPSTFAYTTHKSTWQVLKVCTQAEKYELDPTSQTPHTPASAMVFSDMATDGEVGSQGTGVAFSFSK